MAVGVHTTGFAIHDAKIGLYRPVLELAAETANEALARDPRAFVRVAGLIGDTAQAVREAQIAQALGYHCGLLSLGAWRDAAGTVVSGARPVFREAAAGGAVVPETHVFDTTITTVGAYRAGFERAAVESWHGKLLPVAR